MSRLTKKDKNGYEVKGDNPNTSIAMDISNAVQKLGQLEDLLEKYNLGSVKTLDKDLEICHRLVYEYGQLEEELGIDLITLFKTLNTPIYIKTNYDDTLVNKTLWCSNSLIWGIGEPIIKVGDYAVYTKDYGKTWALTREELQ